MRAKLIALWFLFTLCHCGVSQISQPLPELFLVGDSISIYYTPDLKVDLESEFALARKSSPNPESIADQLSDPQAQGGDSRMVLAYLKTRFADPGFHPLAVLINCGLHDIKRNPKTSTIAVSANEYEDNLRAIISLLQSHDVSAIWINTTPVDDARHNALSKEFYRYNADVKHYNNVAARIMEQHRIPIVDLYGVTAHRGNGHYIDHVHFDEQTRAVQAAYIAGFLDRWNQTRKR
jgi:hypothetical protein